MKFAKNVDLLVNIIFIILIVMFVCAIGVCINGGDSVLKESGEIFDSMPNDGNSPGAGYEALGVMFLGGFSVIAGIALFFVAIMFGFIAFILLLNVVISFSRRKKYETMGDPIFIRRNITSKIIFDVIFIIFSFSTLMDKFHVLSLIEVIVFVGLLVLLIKARKNVKQELQVYDQQNNANQYYQ